MLDKLPLKDKAVHTKADASRTCLIYEQRRSPIMLYGMFIELTRTIYSDADNLPLNFKRVWAEKPEDNKTQVWIDANYIWNDAQVQFRPAILIGLGGLGYRSTSGQPDGRVAMDIEQGEKWYSRTGSGTVTWTHIGRTRGESLAAAETTFDYLDGLSPIIRKDLCFDTFFTQSIQPLVVLPESRERFGSIVAAAFTWRETWSIKLESPKLKRIVFNAGQGLFDMLNS